MATIYDLPTELINDIAGRLLPDTIEALALSCKTILAKCEHTLDKHKRYRAEYGEWENRGPHDGDILYFLHEIAQDSLMAEYVESLNLRDRKGQVDAGERRESGKIDKSLHIIQKLVEKKAPFLLSQTGLHPLDCHYDWLDEVRDEMLHFVPGNIQEPYTMFSAMTLLSLLPNLRELTLHPAWPGGRTPTLALFAYSSVKESTLPFSTSEQCSARCWPLAKLETLLPYNAVSGRHQSEFDMLEPFFILPSLRNAYFMSVQIGERESRTWLRQLADSGSLTQNITSSLRRLEIVHGCCGPHGLKGFLIHCRNLEVLKYAHQEPMHTHSPEFDPSTFISDIRDHVGVTLKELAISILVYNRDLGPIVEGLETLTVLEETELDVRLFECYPTDYYSTPSLSDLLPRSIRTVILDMEDDPSQLDILKCLLDDFVQVRSEKLPNLEKITVRAQNDARLGTSDEHKREARAVVEEQGAEWVLYEAGH
ncbi:hypothetical protein K458DRAFT_287297 [Lentithecium fluviatile CBS 122367]|uniref:F-box domain-containing protein n=1 Tax=Lentithecium fluviatile CBS 122367 TaxID=1168545 RepID=A0A6G1JK05_9PLEO|nr:hypothetical protein K458DRAFT_287297 [Lentithecium fluviatile CBS 122367]